MSTVNEVVVTNGPGLEISSVMPCNMEEADEWIFVHVKRASREHICIMIETVESISYKLRARQIFWLSFFSIV